MVPSPADPPTAGRRNARHHPAVRGPARNEDPQLAGESRSMSLRLFHVRGCRAGVVQASSGGPSSLAQKRRMRCEMVISGLGARPFTEDVPASAGMRTGTVLPAGERTAVNVVVVVRWRSARSPISPGQGRAPRGALRYESAASRCSAASSNRSSQPQGASSCSPIGRASSVNPTGTDTPGMPQRFAKIM